MSDIVLHVENLSKRYRLGVIGSSTLSHDVNRWWAKVRGREDPGLKVHDANKLDATAGDFVWALQDINFEVEQGEVLGIIGKNGAGKSTLLKILSRVTGLTTGRINIKGRIAALLEVGTGFHQELTGRENIYLNGAILGMSKAEIRAKFDQIVEFSGIAKYIDTPVKRYSSGMTVRLAFAVAAHLEPEILIVDEVLAVGDIEFQKKCLGKMKEVAVEGRTVLFVSHNMSAVKGLTTKALWLDKGLIRQEGDTDSIVRAYLESNANESSHDVNLDDLPRNAGNGEEIRFLRVQCNGGQTVEHGKPMSITLDLRCQFKGKTVAFGVALCNMEGSRILSWDSDVAGVDFTLPKGLSQVTLAMPDVDLQPSSYMVDIAVRSDNHYFDYLAGCMRLDIMPGPSTPHIIVRGDGQLRPIVDWSLNKIGE